MTGVNDISNWIQNVLKTSKSYSNKFYYDGHGVIVSREESIRLQKTIIKNLESERQTMEKIHKIRLETPTLFTPFCKDINRLETENFELKLRMEKNELGHSEDTLIILKNLVGLSKITDTLMRELPQSERTKKIIEDFRKFQLTSEPTIDTLKNHLDEKLRKTDDDNRKDR